MRNSKVFLLKLSPAPDVFMVDNCTRRQALLVGLILSQRYPIVQPSLDPVSYTHLTLPTKA